MTGLRWCLGLAASVGVVGCIAVGCGGKSQDGPELPPEDTGAVDTGIAVIEAGKDSGSADSSTAKDTGDVPGSLFDATLPDIAFEGGKTVGGCYDCTKTLCKDELTKCDADPRCRGLTLCILVECGGSTTDTTCLFGCALKYDVTSPTDPVASLALGVANCTQAKCTDKCPTAPDAGADAKSDVKTDSATVEGGAGGGGGGTPASPALPGAGLPGAGGAKSVDPKVIEMLSGMNASFASTPEATSGVVDVLQSHK